MNQSVGYWAPNLPVWRGEPIVATSFQPWNDRLVLRSQLSQLSHLNEKVCLVYFKV